MAHKKAAGSAKNLRDSKPKYRGVKLFGGQKVTAGNIIIRQKGNKYECGENVYMGRDFSIHADSDGFVYFFKKKKSGFNGRKYLKTYVSVTDTNEYLTPESTTTKKSAAKKASATKKSATKKTTTARKATAKKAATTKKTTPAKKATVKKATTTKKTTPAKKATTKKTTATKKTDK